MAEKKLHKYYPGIILFAIALVASLLVFRDYGVGWDEPIHRSVGSATFYYITQNNQTVKHFEFRNLGSGFELPLFALEKILRLKDGGHITLMRHIITHIFFLLGALAGYALALRLFRSRFLGCMAFIMLACHPRMYGHSYFNSKDIPFAACFPIFFLFFQVATEKKKALWYALAGAAAGYATSIREMGLLLPACVGLIALADMAQDISSGGEWKQTLRHYLSFGAGFCLMLYVAWPLLWSNPLFYLVEEFKSLSHIKWDGNLTFNGQSVSGAHLPFIYVPEWIAITTPELWMVAGVVGCIWITAAFVRHPARFYTTAANKNFLLYLGCFAIPIVVVHVLHSINYDDWRHMYFVYPPLVFVALYAIWRLYNSGKKKVVVVLCALQGALVLLSLVQLHPFQHLYFNYFVSHAPQSLRHNFDMDYWGTSYRHGLQYIASHDKRDSIWVAHSRGWIDGAMELLPEQDRKRIILVDEGDPADYFIGNFRNHPQNYPYPDARDSIYLLNSTIMGLYRLR